MILDEFEIGPCVTTRYVYASCVDQDMARALSQTYSVRYKTLLGKVENLQQTKSLRQPPILPVSETASRKTRQLL